MIKEVKMKKQITMKETEPYDYWKGTAETLCHMEYTLSSQGMLLGKGLRLCRGFYSYQQLQYPKSTPANKYIEDLTWEVFGLVLWGRLYHNTGTFGNTNTWFLKSEGDQLFLVSIPWCSPSLM